MRSMQQQLGVLGTISAFAYRHRETKKNLCRGGRTQDLPDTDFQPVIRQLKYEATVARTVSNGTLFRRRKRHPVKQQGTCETPCIGNIKNNMGFRYTKEASSVSLVGQKIPSRILGISQDTLRQSIEISEVVVKWMCCCCMLAALGVCAVRQGDKRLKNSCSVNHSD